MFDTGHDAANGEVFEAEPADAPDLVGVAVLGAKKETWTGRQGVKVARVSAQSRGGTRTSPYVLLSTRAGMRSAVAGAASRLMVLALHRTR